MPKLDKKTRAKAKIQSRKIRLATRRAENIYVGKLRAIAAGYKAVYDRYLVRSVKAVVAVRGDAVKGPKAKATGNPFVDFDSLETAVQAQLKAMVGKAFDVMWDSVYKAHIENSTLPRITIGQAAGPGSRLVQLYEKKRDDSIKLVENAQRVYSDQVREVFSDPANFGLRVEELQAKLVERGNVSESRAELIARDQTLKTLGGINEVRQREAGVNSYTWSTSNDERVRDEHAELEGQVFSWDNPPEEGNPGQPIQCRCVAVPYIDELADLDNLEAF